MGIIAALLLYIFKLLGARRRAFSYSVTIILLIFFVVLTLSRPSVVRAVVMAGIFMAGMLLGRRSDVYNSLGAAALFILIKNPKELSNVGFQLSFCAVLFIIFLSPKFVRLAGGAKLNAYVRRFFAIPLSVSVAAWLGTAPLIFYYFRIITPIAIIANLLIIPALSLMLVSGASFLFLGWLPFLGHLLAGFNNACGQILFSLAEFFASVKFGHFQF